MNVTVKPKSLQNLKLYLKGGYKVNMDTPDLKYLFITGQVLELNSIQSFDSIEEAVLYVEYLYLFEDLSRSQNALKFLYELQNLRLLNLSKSILKAICVSPVMLTFPNLSKIRVFVDCYNNTPSSMITQVLFHLCGRCPNLEVVTIDELL